MPTIADYIAEHIKVLFNESDDVYIEIQRNDLAAKFGCAPSQINYV
ncbi:MAG: CtsR family transcriptional regulator, partial [Bacillota bacterium]|nr:CtsR family transcriptional regulator [Bacillota bacterium]